MTDLLSVLIAERNRPSIRRGYEPAKPEQITERLAETRTLSNRCYRSGCYRPRLAQKLCKHHYEQARRTHTIPIRHPDPDWVEDVEWMLDTDETPSGICRRLDMKLDSIKRRLYRAGRPDLVARLNRPLEAAA